MGGWFSIVNNNQVGGITNDRLEITGINDPKLKKKLLFGKFAQLMKGGVGKKRIKKLCRDTAQIISDTCKGVVELVHFLFLQRNFKYVLLRKFSSDPLENQFGRFRQGCGSSYYLSVQQIVEKLNVYKSKLFLNKNKDAQSLEELSDPGHNCLKCEFQIFDSEVFCEKFDSLPESFDILQCHLEKYKKQQPDFLKVMVYCAGYVMRSADLMTDSELFDCTTYYYHDFKEYFDLIDMGCLQIPNDICFELCSFTIIFFEDLGSDLMVDLCRNSCKTIVSELKDHFDFKVNAKQIHALTNFMFSNFVKNASPKSNASNAKQLEKFKN